MAIEIVTAGESHGKMLVGIMSNLPAGLNIDGEFINSELARRMLGLGRSARMQIEDDRAEIVSGVRAHKSTGSPISLLITNRDYQNWKNTIGADATGTDRRITAVRPGHADLSGAVKYGFSDARNVAERASARSTAMLVAMGAIAKQYLAELGITVQSHTVAIGIVKADSVNDYTDINARADADRVRCLDVAASEKMVGEIRIAALSGDTLGGAAEIVVSGLKSGIGSYTAQNKRLDGIIMGAVGAVPSVKAVEIGDGIAGSSLYGSAVHDEIFVNKSGKALRRTNRAGGIEGGMSNGENIIVRAYFKPIPTLKNGLNTVDISTRKQATAASERADVCAVPAGGVVCEAAVAIALCEALSDMLGGDTMAEVKQRYADKESAV
ncbi:MAG: chorismate synthase [Clostridiales bacterium]|nr:chorismate synthase [Clostridiales bacterium]